MNFGDGNIQWAILTYDSGGHLLKTWLQSQYPEAIAYSKDADAVFVLGSTNGPDGPDAPNYPLLLQYDLHGHVLKSMIPARTLIDGGDSFHQGAGAEIGQPALRITKNRIYIYAPTNREVVICNRDGDVLQHRSISGIVEKISREDGYHLVQVHAIDFRDDGDLVLELLLANGIRTWRFPHDVDTGEAVSVHKAFNGTGLFFLGIEDNQYLYAWLGRDLHVQADDTLEPVPLSEAMENHIAFN